MWICGVVVSGKFVGEIGRDGHVKCCMEAYRRMYGKGIWWAVLTPSSVLLLLL